MHLTSVGDPDPEPDADPQDPHVSGPPGSGSGSICQRFGSGSFPLSLKCVERTKIMPAK